MSKFQDLLEFNGKVNYININWQSINVVNRVVSGLVGRWMGRAEKVKVSATDSLSTKKKKEQLEEIEFKGVKYYKDAENFVYSIDEDEQPSENPIGFWKEKAQVVAFYKTK
jgi:hypothetical protein